MVTNSDYIRKSSLAFVFRIRTETYVTRAMSSSTELDAETKRLDELGVKYDVEQFVHGFGWIM